MLRLKEETVGWEVTVEGRLFQDLIADGRKEDLYRTFAFYMQLRV